MLNPAPPNLKEAVCMECSCERRECHRNSAVTERAQGARPKLLCLCCFLFSQSEMTWNILLSFKVLLKRKRASRGETLRLEAVHGQFLCRLETGCDLGYGGAFGGSDPPC